jgi:hypothetical protein
LTEYPPVAIELQLIVLHCHLLSNLVRWGLLLSDRTFDWHYNWQIHWLMCFEQCLLFSETKQKHPINILFLWSNCCESHRINFTLTNSNLSFRSRCLQKDEWIIPIECHSIFRETHLRKVDAHLHEPLRHWERSVHPIAPHPDFILKCSLDHVISRLNSIQ